MVLKAHMNLALYSVQCWFRSPTWSEDASDNRQEGSSDHQARHAQHPMQHGPCEGGRTQQGQALRQTALKQWQGAHVQPEAIGHR